MAIKALDPTDWILFDKDTPHQLAMRRQLLDEHPDDVLDALPGSEDAVAELLTLLLDHLARHSSDRYRITDDDITDLTTGSRYHSNASAPLDLMGRLVQEDFCLLQKRGDRHHLTAAVLCFPAHWSLAAKIGKPLIDIHEPVPDFAEQLDNPVERLFVNLRAEKPVQRLNWSLVDTDDLYLPPAHRVAKVTIGPDDVGERLRLRVERQTLRRLPRSDAIVFGIRTFVTPLDAAIDTAEVAKALRARLDDMPLSMQTYKNLIDVKAALVTFLEQRSG